jgi:hypothetical protein
VLFLGQYDEGDRYVGYVAAAVGHYVVVVMMSDSYLGAADLTRLNDIAGAAMSRAAGSDSLRTASPPPTDRLPV